MPSFRRLNEELALINLELASLKIPNFYGQNEKFMGWFLRWNKSLLVTTLMTEIKFTVVISRLRGCALQWWKNHKFKRRKKGKQKVRTWKKSRSKFTVAFCPRTYILKRVPPLPKKNGSKSSHMDVHFNKGSPKSSCTLSLPNMVPLEEFVSCEEEEVNEREEGLH